MNVIRLLKMYPSADLNNMLISKDGRDMIKHEPRWDAEGYIKKAALLF